MLIERLTENPCIVDLLVMLKLSFLSFKLPGFMHFSLVPEVGLAPGIPR